MKSSKSDNHRPTVGHDGLKWLNSLAQWKGRGGFGLDKTKSIYERLGSPGDQYKTFHVAGTNGKGSVSCIIASILGQAGFKVGLYTSPHLEKLNERIVIDGEEVSDSLLNDACIEIREKAGELDLSFFEAITLAAFLIFLWEKVDFAVIEVGLGGRLDSTNVLKRPIASIITTIDFDHENILGNSLFEIAEEKAGIIKSNVPVIVGKMASDAISRIRELAILQKADVFALGDAFTITNSGNLKLGADETPLHCSLDGDHQVENTAVATAAIMIGAGTSTNAEDLKVAIIAGPTNVYWPNRLETIVWRHKNVTLDSAHNPAGVKSLISFLDKSEGKKGSISFVFGVIDTKKWREMLDLLTPYAGEFHLVLPDFAEPVALNDIKEYLDKKSIKSICYNDDEGLVAGLQKSSTTEIICCGSMYLTGRLRRAFGFKMKPRWVRLKHEKQSSIGSQHHWIRL